MGLITLSPFSLHTWKRQRRRKGSNERNPNFKQRTLTQLHTVTKCRYEIDHRSICHRRGPRRGSVSRAQTQRRRVVFQREMTLFPLHSLSEVLLSSRIIVPLSYVARLGTGSDLLQEHKSRFLSHQLSINDQDFREIKETNLSLRR